MPSEKALCPAHRTFFRLSLSPLIYPYHTTPFHPGCFSQANGPCAVFSCFLPQGRACNEDSSVCVVCWSLTEQMNELRKQEKKEIPIKVPTKNHAQPCNLMALLEAIYWHIIPICLWLWFLPDSGLFLQWRQLQSWTESRQHSEELGVATCYSKGDLRHRPLY